MRNGKIIIVTGISGSGRKEFCTRYGEINKNSKVYHTGEMIMDLAQDPSCPPITKENILNFPKSRLGDWRKMAFDKILDDLREDGSYNRTLINTHAQFFWNEVYSNAYDWSYLNQIPTDMFITIIDKPSEIKERQMKTKQWESQDLDLRDLLLWQNNEVNVTKGWAENYEKPMYVFPSKQEPETIDSLLESYFLIYLSIPMTNASEEVKARVSEFYEKLLNLGRGINGRPTPIIDPRHIDIEKDVLEGRVKRSIDKQTVERDMEWYIPKVTHIVVCYPPESEISAGASYESLKSYASGKHVSVIFPRKEKSPFIDEAQEVFKNEDEFFDFFKGHMKEKIEEFKRS